MQQLSARISKCSSHIVINTVSVAAITCGKYCRLHQCSISARHRRIYFFLQFSIVLSCICTVLFTCVRYTAEIKISMALTMEGFNRWRILLCGSLNKELRQRLAKWTMLKCSTTQKGICWKSDDGRDIEAENVSLKG